MVVTKRQEALVGCNPSRFNRCSESLIEDHKISFSLMSGEKEGKPSDSASIPTSDANGSTDSNAARNNVLLENLKKRQEKKNSDEKEEEDVDEEEEEVEVEVEEVEEVVYVIEEVSSENPRTIETGDSVKVKQVFDDSTIECLNEKTEYPVDYGPENIKMILMFVSCLFAMIAQFYPIPFPESRPLLGVCCAGYFILSGVLQFIITVIDVDLVATTLAKKTKDANKFPPLMIRTRFEKYQEWLYVIIHYASDKNDEKVNDKISTGKMYVGKYFTEEGEFLENIYHRDLITHIKRFEEGKYGKIKYDHKND